MNLRPIIVVSSLPRRCAAAWRGEQQAYHTNRVEISSTSATGAQGRPRIPAWRAGKEGAQKLAAFSAAQAR